MKKKNFNIIIFCLIIMVVIIFLLTGYALYRDLSNNGIENLTDRYDWLSYAGGLLSFLSTTLIGIIALFQNKTLSDINKTLVTIDLKTNGYSKIDFYSEQFIYNRKNDDIGLKVLYCNGNNNCDKFVKFLINIEEQNKKILSNFSISNFLIKANNNLNFEKSASYEFKTVDASYKMVTRELTPPFPEYDIYYMTIVCMVDEELENIIRDSDCLRLEFDATVKNCFGVSIVANYLVEMKKKSLDKQDDIGNKIKYTTETRKISFEKVEYFDI